VLIQRLTVAAVGLPALALLLWAPERWFAAVVTFVLAAAAYELFRAAVPERPPIFAGGAAVLAALIVSATRSVEGFEPASLLPAVGLVLLLLLRGDRFAVPASGWWILAALYPSAPGSHFVLLRLLDDGQAWLIVLLAATFATDTGAYAVGRLIGRHHMAPAISPGKTWEGAAGGFVFGAAGVVAASFATGVEADAAAIAAIALALPVAAQAGDLLESAIKRRIGVKDMSRLLPGHGGLLDRLDSLLVVGPTLYWLVRWLAT
jgi:phosphatidate cytidylyltransferase